MPYHAGTMYLGAIADNKGRRLAAGKTYRVRVPKEVPAKEFWSVTVYDMATWAFIYSPQERPGLSSFEKSKMKMNPDGSVDFTLGRRPPKGSNQTGFRLLEKRRIRSSASMGRKRHSGTKRLCCRTLNRSNRRRNLMAVTESSPCPAKAGPS